MWANELCDAGIRVIRKFGGEGHGQTESSGATLASSSRLRKGFDLGGVQLNELHGGIPAGRLRSSLLDVADRRSRQANLDADLRKCQSTLAA